MAFGLTSDLACGLSHRLVRMDTFLPPAGYCIIVCRFIGSPRELIDTSLYVAGPPNTGLLWQGMERERGGGRIGS